MCNVLDPPSSLIGLEHAQTDIYEVDHAVNNDCFCGRRLRLRNETKNVHSTNCPTIGATAQLLVVRVQSRFASNEINWTERVPVC
jgi:hypothetical protein